MSERIDAIFDHGVLKPLGPLSLPDKARVKVIVETPTSDSAEQVARPKKVDDEGEASNGGVAVSDFDVELDALLFNGPSLPPDFSRADIYADHD